MTLHRAATRLVATLVFAGSLLAGGAAASTSAATPPPPPPVLGVTSAPPPPGFCDVTFCYVIGTGGVWLAGGLQAPVIQPPLSLKLAIS